MFLVDGTRYTYNHRSFQEYFAALFLIQIPSEQKLEVYRRFLDREGTDTALALAFEMNQSMVEREFVKPMLEALLKVAKTPEQLLCSCMSGLHVERRESTKKVDGKRITTLGKPRYSVESETDFWRLQMFVERMYPKYSKKHIKFGAMTQKAFVEMYGTGNFREVIITSNKMSEICCSKLERLGILEISRKRLEFLKWLENDIRIREQRKGDSDIEAWL